MKKTYFARVHGNFPDDINSCTKPIYCKSLKDGVYAVCEDDEKVKLNGK